MKIKDWYNLSDLLDKEDFEKLQNDNKFHIDMNKDTILFFKKIDLNMKLQQPQIKAFEDIALLKQKTKKSSVQSYLLSRILRKLAK